MSRIADRIQEIKAHQEMDVMSEDKKTSISIRVEDFTLYCIEKLMKEIGGSRAAVCLEMVREGVLDGLEPLGHTMDSLQAEYIEECQKRHEARKEAK